MSAITSQTATRAVAVTPSDTGEHNCTALYIGVSGDVAVVTAAGNAVTFKAAPVGILPVQVSRVKSTGTTATDILALS